LTEPGIIAAIGLSVPTADAADKDAIALAFMNAAILRVGRIPGADFNRTFAPITLTVDKSSYVLGQDILSGVNAWSVEEMWRTDVDGWPVEIIGFDDFNDLVRGNTTTGAPRIATIHSEPAVLEVHPVPDSAYTCKAYVSRSITKLANIPGHYHDVILTTAQAMLKAIADPQVALMLAQEGIKDMKGDSRTGWTGSRIKVARGLDQGDGTSRRDSGNLR